MVARLVRLPIHVSRQAGSSTSRNSETNKDDDSKDRSYTHGYPTCKIKKNALNTHCDSVDLIGLIRNVTLVSIVVRGRFGGIQAGIRATGHRKRFIPTCQQYRRSRRGA
jgi:hypothetical protein